MTTSARWLLSLLLITSAARAELPPLIVDGDADGISDEVDDCLYTPPGIRINERGCPLLAEDGDADGVADPQDDCPYTSPGARVDSHGCAIDTDLDGVADGIDRCAGTPVGIPVDAQGCPAGMLPRVERPAPVPSVAPQPPVPAAVSAADALIEALRREEQDREAATASLVPGAGNSRPQPGAPPAVLPLAALSSAEAPRLATGAALAVAGVYAPLPSMKPSATPTVLAVPALTVGAAARVPAPAGSLSPLPAAQPTVSPTVGPLSPLAPGVIVTAAGIPAAPGSSLPVARPSPPPVVQSLAALPSLAIPKPEVLRLGEPAVVPTARPGSPPAVARLSVQPPVGPVLAVSLPPSTDMPLPSVQPTTHPVVQPLVPFAAPPQPAAVPRPLMVAALPTIAPTALPAVQQLVPLPSSAAVPKPASRPPLAPETRALPTVKATAPDLPSPLPTEMRESVQFAIGSAELGSEALARLRPAAPILAAMLARNPQLRVDLAALADRRESRGASQLVIARAEAARQVLVAQGVPRERIRISIRVMEDGAPVDNRQVRIATADSRAD